MLGRYSPRILTLRADGQHRAQKNYSLLTQLKKTRVSFKPRAEWFFVSSSVVVGAAGIATFC